ncbi:putative RNA-directed DNA polymerase [Helianthus annuus]|nr:putative RNA-directed DNA polymerase [Helianthus annuus]KAJ0516275.1 putative RNA-directed DNA polymerase [Helianthus annuus]
MAASTNNSSNQPLLPVFKGEGYEYRSIRLKTVLRSQELWELVSTGFDEEDKDATRLKENVKKDARALALIQQAVHDSVFSRIAASTTAKMAWNVLQTEYQGDSKEKAVKLQGLRREFETLQMKDEESVADFLSTVMKIVNQKRAYGEDVTDQTVIEKVLRSLPMRWDHVVTTIEESKDLSTLTFNQLMGSLQSHEARVNRSFEKGEDERVFQAHEVDNQLFTRGRGRGGMRGRGRGRGRSGGRNRNSIQCFNCNRLGHVRSECWFEPQVNNAAVEQIEEEEENRLFMAISDTDPTASIWFIDSGSSNHMTGKRSLYRDLDSTKKVQVKMGNGKGIQVEGKGVVKLIMSNGQSKVLYDVHYAPALDYNLLSVGQLMRTGYSVLFDDDKCVITHKASKKMVCSIRMSTNNTFSLNVNEGTVLEANVDETMMWHNRYGHLHVQALQHLSNDEIVHGLPLIEGVPECEGCIYGKQTRNPFPHHAWRATHPLQLIHADLVGPMQTPSLGGNRFYFLLTDDYTRHNWVYFLKQKSEDFGIFKNFKAKVENESGVKIKKLRTDRGGEFLSKMFNDFCEENGIHRDLTAPYTPEQNGIAERKTEP